MSFKSFSTSHANSNKAEQKDDTKAAPANDTTVVELPKKRDEAGPVTKP
jgi:hypothetical protein